MEEEEVQTEIPHMEESFSENGDQSTETDDNCLETEPDNPTEDSTEEGYDSED